MNWKPNRRVIATLLVTALLLFAGCTGPADGGNGTVAGADDGGAVGPTDDGAGAGDGGAGADDGGAGMNETTEAGGASISPAPV